MECCDHLSEFSVHSDEIGMSKTFDKVCEPKLKINYTYDFGSSTYLELSVMNNYALDVPEKILLLSRNEPLKIMCATCNKKPALNICTVCMYEDYAFYCKTCSKKHAEECEDFNDYAEIPVVNSPRLGTCGYTGGTIDTERDGYYKR